LIFQYLVEFVDGVSLISYGVRVDELGRRFDETCRPSSLQAGQSGGLFEGPLAVADPHSRQRTCRAVFAAAKMANL